MPEAILIDVRQRLQELDGAHRVVDLVAAVIDRVVMGFAVARAAAVVGADDDVAAFDGVLDERKHVHAPIAMHAAVDPDHRRVSFRAALLERLKEIRRDVHVAGAAAVRHLLEVHDALAGLRVPRFSRDPTVDVALEVVSARVIGGILADIELARAIRIHRRLRTGAAGVRGLRRRRRLSLLLRRRRSGRDEDERCCHGRNCEMHPGTTAHRTLRK